MKYLKYPMLEAGINRGRGNINEVKKRLLNKLPLALVSDSFSFLIHRLTKASES